MHTSEVYKTSALPLSYVAKHERLFCSSGAARNRWKSLGHDAPPFRWVP